MSVWPGFTATRPTLAGSEGTLISIAVHVAPQSLEALLEALAQVDFPVNPQIYHDAVLRYIYADGREEVEPTTVVEFPAYERRLPEVRAALAAYGFAPDSLHVTEMLSGLHSDSLPEPAPPGAAYVKRAIDRHGNALSAAH